MLRKLLVLPILAAGVFALYHFVWLPHHCNLVRGRATRSLTRVWERRHTYTAQLIAKRNALELVQCLDRHPENVALALTAAMNLEVAQRFELAGAVYCDALRYDRRPELYLGCGRLRISQGRRDEALAMFIAAGEFAGIDRLRQVEDPELRWAAIRTVGARWERQLAAQGKLDTRNLVTNGMFGTPGRRGKRSEMTAAGQAPSAAHSWFMLNRARTPAATELVASDRTRGGSAIHVSVAAPGGGLRQVWPSANRRPRVRATAWVRVNRGTVCIGASNGKDMLTNACSKSTGVWEKLEAVNDSCPASSFAILATSPDGADFLVDEASARLTYAAPPCER